MNPYTIIMYLPYEDHEQTYRADVRADTPRKAVKKAQAQAIAANGSCFEPEDFEVLMVTRGWITEVIPERYT